MAKYKITEHHLDTKSGIHKLERDGFSRHEIIDSMYKLTPGLKQCEQRELVSKLYARERGE